MYASWVNSYKWSPQLYVSYVLCQEVTVTHTWLKRLGLSHISPVSEVP